ncbi:MAG: hypothetical protein IH606_05885 [Burkholderiales bacterium]|nr:hypothetical protein [Burkholderiales bacterium]
MQPNDLPLVCLPVGLSDEAAAQVLEFLNSLTEAFERHYADQLHRYYDATEQRKAEHSTRPTLTDPPF